MDRTERKVKALRSHLEAAAGLVEELARYLESLEGQMLERRQKAERRNICREYEERSWFASPHKGDGNG